MSRSRTFSHRARSVVGVSSESMATATPCLSRSISSSVTNLSGSRPRQLRPQNFCWEQKEQRWAQPRAELTMASFPWGLGRYQ